MEIIFENEEKKIERDEKQVITTDKKTGGRIITQKHPISWHEKNPHVPSANCIFCLQPERSKREDLDFIKLSDEFWNNVVDKHFITSGEKETVAINVLESFANWLNLKMRCSEH